MAITVNIYYSGEKGNALKFAQEMLETGIVAEIRRKAGNLRYEYFVPIENHETLLLIDQWENQQALDEHHQTDTMQRIIDLREKYGLKMKVERYVEDDQGIPEQDKKYIVE